ncbi:fpg protein [Lactobacillus selangorensis]|uniref:Formamidopyrimidine-DNA glycosylase n=1 Tax=Lactobacillus selangorensis TaxID=81857 RepID=A0A0R2FZR4_9LACO|nr:DNA-formamidopyrimidine glycosylase [Lactobacillus selangorensis]KRN29743.1 fpg protein [Lactobacillus selangorensis]KRN33728.1 fpg protein [Lactobacillus selangorensis]
MPELPEVETVRRGLTRLVIGKKIAAIELIYPKIVTGDSKQFKQQLTGQTIEAIDRRGKYLLFRFSNGLTMVSHLRMEGHYHLAVSKEEPLEKHTHVIFRFTDGTELRYLDSRKFGRMQLILTGTEASVPGLAKLGPEPTEAAFKKAAFYQQLQRHHKAIKTTLLDQTAVTGLGNIYVDEVLWLTFIHPETPANELTRAQTDFLHDTIIRELDWAITLGGTTVHSFVDANGNAGAFQKKLHVYGRKGEPCDRCGTPIEKIKVGQRGTHFCPSCQKIGQVRFE